MPNPRLELALDLIKPADWRAFEVLAAEFLVVEFPNLKTTASASGDRGRDGELFVINGEPTVGFQYSVTADWDSKIRQTAARLGGTFPTITRIVYVTCKEIGAKADDLVANLWANKHLQIDIRDRSWFVERELSNPQRSTASAEIIERFVNPMLVSRGIKENVAQALSDEEGRLALLHLTLDSRDADDRNLTKSCFDALVLSVLHDTSVENMLSLNQISEQVEKIVPHGAAGQVNALVTTALKRLSDSKTGPVKHHRKVSQYHIAFSESEKIRDQAATYLLGEESLEKDMAAGLWGLDNALDSSAESTVEEARNLRKFLEIVLMKRGESFAAAVQEGGEFMLDTTRITSDLHEAGYTGHLSTAQAASAMVRVLAGPSDSTRMHLRRLVDAYTLFAFLKLTPDVQKTMLKVFSEGDIWLDTSAVLPLFGELLLDDPDTRYFTALLAAARHAGMNLYVTGGVLEEISGHLNRCLNATNWSGRDAVLPFIYATYVLSGRDAAEFPAWIQEIRGNIRPIDDIRDFLQETFGIEQKSLADLADAASTELRGAVQELWHAAHDRRRQGVDNFTDPATVTRLVAHDVENTVGVIEARKVEATSPMGYRTWWLTLDRTALRLRDYLRDKLGDDAPASPALSPDFLAQLLRLGPMRSRLERGTLPVASDLGRLDEAVTKDLLELASETRAKFAGMSELRIRREVRDTLDSARARVGTEAMAGSKGVEERLASQLTGEQ